MTGVNELVDGVLEGDVGSLARLITYVENQRDGYREALKRLYPEAGNAYVVGVTGSPGTGKSTLVDELVEVYRDRGDSVGVLAVDPSSPYTGGSILGDRIRMRPRGDDGVFFRSMSARGELGGLAAATRDAVTALDAYGFDVIVIETVGAGQNEVEVMGTADSVVVLVTPESGDDVQLLKAGILEIGDVFVVNKADLDGADRMVMEVQDMIEGGEWDREPPVVSTVAKNGDGVLEVIEALDDHHEYLLTSGGLRGKRVERVMNEVQALIEDEVSDLVSERLENAGGVEGLAERIVDGDSDPYTEVEGLMEPVRDCLDDE